MTVSGRDWQQWHHHYDDAGSDLARRLAEVRRQVAALVSGPPVRLLSMCSGDGRDTLPVLAEHAPATEALLVERDPVLADRARATAADLGLTGVVVRTGDAGSTDAYAGFAPADVVLACGVFGNVTDDHMARTVATLPRLLTAGGHVVWTRGAAVPGDPSAVAGDPAEEVRRVLAATGFAEVTLVRGDADGFRVGVHRLAVPPQVFVAGAPMFAFTRG